MLLPTQVGAGKSSLLSALLGEMGRTGGVANVRGEVAFVAQQVLPPSLTDGTKAFSQAWIRNQTLKENIMFDKPFSDKLYKKVFPGKKHGFLPIPRCWRRVLWRLIWCSWQVATPLRSVRREST